MTDRPNPPCLCCTCSYDTMGNRDNPDPACHVHGQHGNRGCAKHEVEATTCKCGCRPDLERHAEMLARGERLAEKQQFDGEVEIRTDDTPEELAALAKVKSERAAAAAEAAIEQARALLAAVEARNGDREPGT